MDRLRTQRARDEPANRQDEIGPGTATQSVAPDLVDGIDTYRWGKTALVVKIDYKAPQIPLDSSRRLG
jgi:hypothetical protein